jgi:hypothetical protein
MVMHLVGESARKQLKTRSGSGRGIGRISWRRWYIEGPLLRQEHWPKGQPYRRQGHTNCRLLEQRCSDKAQGGDLQEGPLMHCALWLEPGRAFGPGLGFRQDLRCALTGISNGWGDRPLWGRVVAFYFGNYLGLSLCEYQRKASSGVYFHEPDHLPLPGVQEHLRHRYCHTNHLEAVTRQVNQDRRAAERRGEDPYRPSKKRPASAMGA